jgi:hypothetical protein
VITKIGKEMGPDAMDRGIESAGVQEHRKIVWKQKGLVR